MINESCLETMCFRIKKNNSFTDQKEVYTCGNGENGQLGHGTSKQQLSVPEKLNLPFKVTAICCGENHTALLSGKN